MAPGPYVKRVTLQYRALRAADASRVLQQEVNAAAFRSQVRRRTGRDETARDARDSARARQAASEEAMGAGVCLVSMYITVTVTDPGQLKRAVADTETAARVAAAVRASLRRWEPPIEVRDVIVSFDSEDSSTIYIDIRYAVGETNDPRNLVFPFYVIPAEST